MTDSHQTMFEQAQLAIDQKDLTRARELLTRLLRSEPNNTNYWLWMSAAVESKKEQIYCLQQVLRIDPKNLLARRGLIILGAIPPDKSITPMPPLHRNWKNTLLKLMA